MSVATKSKLTIAIESTSRLLFVVILYNIIYNIIASYRVYPNARIDLFYDGALYALEMSAGGDMKHLLIFRSVERP